METPGGQNFLVSAPSPRTKAVTVKLADLENSVIRGGDWGLAELQSAIPDTLDWTAPELLLRASSAERPPRSTDAHNARPAQLTSTPHSTDKHAPLN
eukprot:COSAG01_NODE_7225_length_3297_cov_4.925578_1_plen_97_part_00